jgi:putative spermidine/putrescine transport system permease protein
VTVPAQALVQGGIDARPAPRRFLGLLGLAPFGLFALLFLFLPVSFLVVGSFQSGAGALTLQNYSDLSQQFIIDAYSNSIEISAVTAIAGGIAGLLLAYAVVSGRLPRWLQGVVLTFCGVASNFAGVPLALAFIFTIGHNGIVTNWLSQLFGFDLYGGSFSLYTKIGLEVVYFYFQLPLMVLIMAPAIEGLKPDWREAAENLGATTSQYWRTVALPVLTPTILGTMILLFANSFGAQATAYQLTACQVNLTTCVISAELRGNVLHNVGLGYALAMGMVVIMAIALLFYVLLQRRAERWLR